jgi:hypothetical protein
MRAPIGVSLGALDVQEGVGRWGWGAVSFTKEIGGRLGEILTGGTRQSVRARGERCKWVSPGLLLGWSFPGRPSGCPVLFFSSSFFFPFYVFLFYSLIV